MKLLLYALLAASLCLAALPFAPAKAAAVTLPYDGGTLFSHSTIDQECHGSPVFSVGVVCLALPKGASALRFDVQDESKLLVGGSYYIYDASGALVAMGAHCDGADVPAASGGTAVVRLEVLSGPRACLGHGTAGEPTRGVVDFVIR